MSTLSTTQIFSLVICIIILGIYLPLSIYGTFRFFQRRHHIIIKKRYSQITFIICFLLIIVIICEGVRAPVKSFKYTWEWWFFHPIVSLLSTMGCWLTLKIYLNYFDVNYANAILSSEWKTIINVETMQTNWFILNKRYGTIKRWNNILIIISIFNIFGAYVWELIYTDQLKKMMYANLISVFISLMCIIIMTIIRCRTPIFHDIFYQRHEIIGIIRPALVAILYIIISLVIKFPTEESQNINQLFVFLSFATLSAWIIYTTTIRVVSNNAFWFNLTEEDRIELNIYHVAKSSMALTQTQTQTKTKKTKSKPNMKTVMENEKGFEALMFHTAQEFSSEILLSAVELTQFQQIVNEYYISLFEDNISCGEILSKDNWLVMPKTIPKSQIVYGNVDGINENDCKPKELMQRALHLYMKYIQVNSELEINISGVCRRKLMDIFENGEIESWLNVEENESEKDKIKRIYVIFEETMDELYGVVNTLFTRFKQSALFEKLCNDHIQL